MQHLLVHGRKTGRIKSDMVLVSEHRPVFTLGRRGGEENLRISEDVFKKIGISVLHIERGGNITFHGPGQLMVYPIIDLRNAGLRIPEYVSDLEEIMIRICRDWEIDAKRIPGNPGVWVDGSKIGSLGIAVRRGISFHGLALNVNVDLAPFSWIHPCGLVGVQATSMAHILGGEIPMENIQHAATVHIQDIFNVELEPINLLHFLSSTCVDDSENP